MTGWHAYGMLTFHLYCWNQLKVIHLACRALTRSVLSNATPRVIYILLKNLTAELLAVSTLREPDACNK